MNSKTGSGQDRTVCREAGRYVVTLATTNIWALLSKSYCSHRNVPHPDLYVKMNKFEAKCYQVGSTGPNSSVESNRNAPEEVWGLLWCRLQVNTGKNEYFK